MRDLGIYWACDNCLFAHANGVDLRYESDHGMDYDPETNPSPEPEPWSLLKPGQHPALGMTVDAHDCEKNPEHEGYDESADAFDCDCETYELSRSSCDGCGNTLHGARHAVTVFQD
jgi:hypothetical protein